MRRTTAIVLALFLVAAISRCNLTPGGVRLDVEKPAFLRLSDYAFFSGRLADLQPADRVTPYDLITPLFSDYAFKARFVYVPQGQQADYQDTEVFDFPVGSALIKNFYYPEDFGMPKGLRRIVETRLLVRRKAGWDALPYVWNEAQTEAFLEVAGGNTPVSWTDEAGEQRQIDYSIPNKIQCKSCHNRHEVLEPIGPKARNLNRPYAYADGTSNQLERWVQSGILQDPGRPFSSPLADWEDPVTGNTEERAKAYMEVNCGHCHSKSGPAATSGLYLMVEETSAAHWGICKSPVAAGKGSGGLLYDVVPGKPQESILTYRMISDAPSIMMPELGRKIAHREAVTLISEWILGLDGDCPPNR